MTAAWQGLGWSGRLWGTRRSPVLPRRTGTFPESEQKQWWSCGTSGALTPTARLGSPGCGNTCSCLGPGVKAVGAQTSGSGCFPSAASTLPWPSSLARAAEGSGHRGGRSWRGVPMAGPGWERGSGAQVTRGAAQARPGDRGRKRVDPASIATGVGPKLCSEP